ncbi:2',3'-cyclic-nucleotide 3'-phosphodiesterase-like isoform X2 [Homarus americanus]|uniref:2',3'-cyclic-nucleotide 3'-phosphodiesterase-like n=1 Tax=Homarus americanus TaxID=6706 RepID=A0A8J5JER7_HOMAM|nr:2',3'-cyclic-nucleotide 3'-phosphodiesterase-like isoform X2 [Homarus americanus]XP_042206376.1 2',3'-cyclic-nucleotide 3'-phosphodiesterase-like isoform X2 [Homarus americanus]KAG7155073.1 2',3'-cyclic-nucleotide 3'-phosphodiesterase-like [Homarus americanus]
MTWLWWRCCFCWKDQVREEEEDQEEICAATTTNSSESSLDVATTEDSVTMGQTASRINNLFRRKCSATPSPDHEDDAQVSQEDTTFLIPSAVVPSYPLATPRSPLRRGTRPLDLSEISPARPPSKRLKGDIQYLDFPVLKSDETIKFVQNSKIMLILKGIPGSGKSFIAQKIKEVYEDAVVCSADSYFMRDGEYQFDRDQLKEAHEFCQHTASEAAKEGLHVIVIDNTNVRNWEMKYYLDLAKEHHYIPLVMETQTPWAMDSRELALKNSHDIPQKIIAQKVKSYQPVQPIYYGWFINEVDSKKIYSMGQEWLQQILNVDDFFQDFSQNTQLDSGEEILKFFSLDSDAEGKTLHATAKFTGRGKQHGAMEYMKNSIIRRAMGQCFQLHIIGFVITPRTFGARLKLTWEELELWGNDDNEDPPESVFQPVVSRKDNVNCEEQPQEFPNNMEQNDITNKCKRAGCQLTCRVVDAEIGEDRFHPTSGNGSRAHLTLAYAPTVKPVCTGFDLISAVKCEQRAFSKGMSTDSQLEDQKVETYNIRGGVLRNYGEGTWVVYPEKELVVSSMFSAFY